MKNFASYKSQLNDFLIKFLKQQQVDFQETYFSKDVFGRLLVLATGGKMWRGSLLVNTYEKLTGKKFSQRVLAAAAGLELAQTAFLIHDDIIDQDELRRGQPTLHFQYKQRAEQKKYQQPQRAGENQTLCVGDLIFFLVYKLLPLELVKLFSQQLARTALGEMQDVELALMRGEQVVKKDILQMYQDKTASYSVSLPLMAGAVLATQDKKTLLQLNELGQTLGLIFQLKDDELGLFGDREKTGKPVEADIREGKKTLHFYYLLQKAQKTVDKNFVLKVFGKDDLSEIETQKVLRMMKKYQVRQKVEENLSQLATQAREQLRLLKISRSFKDMMGNFLEINLKRKK